MWPLLCSSLITNGFFFPSHCFSLLASFLYLHFIQFGQQFRLVHVQRHLEMSTIVKDITTATKITLGYVILIYIFISGNSHSFLWEIFPTLVNYYGFISHSPKFCNSLTLKVTVNCLQFPVPTISLLNCTHIWLAASFHYSWAVHREDNSSFLPSHAEWLTATSLPSMKLVAGDRPWNVITCQQKVNELQHMQSCCDISALDVSAVDMKWLD